MSTLSYGDYFPSTLRDDLAARLEKFTPAPPVNPVCLEPPAWPVASPAPDWSDWTIGDGMLFI